jgi:UDP-N-acetylglucosamine--N-acetylmuramyl-(pentapeptide) pyrophosphoryl-undecaprenol N-acetylglucosamine transferase
MPRIVVRLLEQVPGLTVLHQAGARMAESVEAAYAETGAPSAANGGRWTVSAFLDDMGARFAAADLILARSGASTVAELAAAGKPSLLVPFPEAADDHQTRNAEVLATANAAILMPQNQMTDEKLLQQIISLLADRPGLAAMGERARKLAHPDAAQRIVGMVMDLAQKETG